MRRCREGIRHARGNSRNPESRRIEESKKENPSKEVWRDGESRRINGRFWCYIRRTTEAIRDRGFKESDRVELESPTYKQESFPERTRSGR